MGTKKPQELNQQLNLKPGTKSSASGTKLLTLSLSLVIGVMSDTTNQIDENLTHACTGAIICYNTVKLPDASRFLCAGSDTRTCRLGSGSEPTVGVVGGLEI